MLNHHPNRHPDTHPDIYADNRPDGSLNNQPILCLTFDDGPDLVYTPQLLDLLDYWQIPAAFFVVGRQASAHPDLLRRMEAAGHTVGLHSNIHKSVYLMTPRQTAEDFRQSVETLRAAGLHPKYYRPPWGHATPASRRLAGQYGLTPVYWDVMAQDWKASITEDEILHRLLQRTGAAAGQVPARPRAAQLGTDHADQPGAAWSGTARPAGTRPGAIGGDWFAAARPGETLPSERPGETRPGAIVCLHDGRGRRQAPQRMVHALGRAVEMWKAEGFRFVTLEEFLSVYPKKATWRRGL